jgi:hypothetical protein
VKEKYAMKKVKIAFWIVVFGFIGLIIFQNKEFFMAESRLMIDLGFFYYETPFLANAIFFVAFFLDGYFDLLFFKPVQAFHRMRKSSRPSKLRKPAL